MGQSICCRDPHTPPSSAPWPVPPRAAGTQSVKARHPARFTSKEKAVLQVGHPGPPELDHWILHILLSGNSERGQGCCVFKIVTAMGHIQDVLGQTSSQRAPRSVQWHRLSDGHRLRIQTEPRGKETALPLAGAVRGPGREGHELHPNCSRVLAGRLNLDPESCAPDERSR